MYTVPSVLNFLMLCCSLACLIVLIRDCFKVRQENISIYTVHEKGKSQPITQDCAATNDISADCQIAGKQGNNVAVNSSEDFIKENNLRLVKQQDNVSVFVVFDTRQK